jgi:hypothetical protein
LLFPLRFLKRLKAIVIGHRVTASGDSGEVEKVRARFSVAAGNLIRELR